MIVDDVLLRINFPQYLSYDEQVKDYVNYDNCFYDKFRKFEDDLGRMMDEA